MKQGTNMYSELFMHKLNSIYETRDFRPLMSHQDCHLNLLLTKY